MKKSLIILIFFLLFILFYTCNIDNIPESIVLLKNEKISINTLYGIEFKEENYVNTSTSSLGESSIKKVNVTLGGIKVKQVNVTILPEVEVIPIGKIVGLKLYTSGILVVGINENILNESDIKEGDAIISINNEKVESIENIKSIVEKSNGEDLLVKYIRDNDEILVSTISPVKTEDNSYKLGLWVKEGATGVGTISFYNPETNDFAALGHGVYDKDTGELLKIEEGSLLNSKVISISKGEYGMPGEIKGALIEDDKLGDIEKNTEFGIYGSLNINNISSNDKIKVARLHSATHLLHAALRKVVGDYAEQRGSNITPERLRFDFACDHKLTPEELSKVQDFVNEAIKADVEITCEETDPQTAKNSGAIGIFDNKYGDKVTVYTMGNFSKEICGGPHAKRTGELGKFVIQKEESSSSGVRRIKATLE